MPISKSMLGVVGQRHAAMPLHESRLTTSFRFGDAIADVANSLLGALNETVPLLGNPNVKSSVVNKPHTKMRDAILCRTNARNGTPTSGLVHGDKVNTS